MKKFCLITFVFFNGLTSFSQLFDGDEDGKIWTNISVYYDQGYISGQHYQGIRIDGDIEIIKNLSLRYNIGFGNRADSVRYFHLPAGTLLGPPMVLVGAIGSLGDDPDSRAAALFAAGLVLCVLPEGLQYNFYPVKCVKVSPYVMFTGIDFARNLETRKLKIQYSPSFGGKISLIQKDGFTLSCWYEIRSYSKVGFGQFWGAGLGARF